MSKPRLLDLFCGGGGCSMGYHRAGFDVVGVDSEPQPRYPFIFYQGDALTFNLADFDVIHASPVCKDYTGLNLAPKGIHPRLIGAIRERLQASGKPYIIENVMGAKYDLRANLLLCGTMFGLPTKRHRLFEIGNFDALIMTPPCNHAIAHIIIHGNSVWDSWQKGTIRKDGRQRPGTIPVEIGRQAMGIDWMSGKELSQAIPPAYTEWIGQQILEWRENDGAAS